MPRRTADGASSHLVAGPRLHVSWSQLFGCNCMVLAFLVLEWLLQLSFLVGAIFVDDRAGFGVGFAVCYDPL